MKLGIFGDVHANLPALDAVYQTLKSKKCDKIVSTGDVVGYGPQPGECIDFFIENKIPCVCGNHDEYALLGLKGVDLNDQAREVIEWTRGVLEYKHYKWLAELPLKLTIGGVDIVHASHVPTKKWFYIYNQETAEKNFQFQKSEVTFYGHTHIPIIAAHIDGFADQLRQLKSGPLYGGDKFMINVGSVGQPRDNNTTA
ncbi:MAG: metallophosphoesterase family protein, partial [Lentisphaeria bacterium]